MKTTNKNRLAIGVKVLALRIIFPLCLAFTCLSQANAQVTTGTTKYCVPTEDAFGKWSCYTPTGIGPGPGGGGSGTAINPNDYGMCGLLSLSGTLDNPTVAEIIVKNGYYEVFTSAASKSDLPVVEYTCAHFTDFTGLPPSSEAEAYQSPIVRSLGSIAAKDTGNSQEACIWAGVAGGIAQTGAYAIAELETAGYTWVSAQTSSGTSLATYAFCSTFTSTSPTWTKWVYDGPNGWNASTGGTVSPLPFPKNQYWCYMEGVLTIPVTFSAGLIMGASDYEEQSTPGTAMAYHCLPFKQ